MKKMNKKGFTLVEMLVVIAIIAILVSILIPTVLGATKKAKAATDAANLRSVLAEFQIAYLTEDGNVSGWTADASAGTYSKEFTGNKLNSGDGEIKAAYIVVKVAEGSNADACYSESTAFDTDHNINHYANIAGTNS